MRSSSKIFDNKTKKMQEKMKGAKREEKNPTQKRHSLKGTKRTFSERTIKKIHSASRPTKSKLIVKGGGGGHIRHGGRNKGR